MPEATLRVLEFDKVRALLARFTATEPGRELASALLPLSDPAAVPAALAAVSEMTALLATLGPPPVGGCREVRPALAAVRAEGSWLVPEVLLDILSSIEAAAACRRLLAEGDDRPHLAALAGQLAPLKALRQSLAESIGGRGEILDRASFELGEIRHEILNLRSRLRRVLEALLANENLAGVFQDRIVTERNGRYVVPVRADHRGRVKGFIHDESASGQTLFIEPAAVLEQNNELQSRLREEKREEERILRRLSAGVRQVAGELEQNQQVLARLDFLAAAGRFSRLSDGQAPRLAPQRMLELRQARHPLLLFQADGRRRQEPVVAIDLLLGEHCDTLVVSGPNTGGKTVALKTAGLLVLMVRSGLHIPCHPDSRVYLFDQVFADIGDLQSIEASLSTFSGHLTRIGEILAAADAESLVLLDEIGTGTDPAEGGALAMAVIDTLRERGTRAMVTTHLNLVKGYAHLAGGIENAAVEFDSVTLAPSYRLHYGIPGASNAFAIARRLGLSSELIARAEGYLGEGEREGLQLIEELNRLRRDAAAEAAQARSLLEKARQERDKRKQLLVELEQQKRALLEKAAQRAERLLRTAEDRLKELFAEAGQSVLDVRERAHLSGRLKEVRSAVTQPLQPEANTPAPAPTTALVGELLRVPALGVTGEVVRVLDTEVELSLQGKKLRLPLAQLEVFSPRRFAAKAKAAGVRSQVARETVASRLLLVGRRAEEALILLDRFLDDALLQGLSEVEVVHGSGEGVLRRAVREFAAAHRGVTAFHAADPAQGGDNVTVVKLRGE